MEKFTLINKARSRIKVFEPFEDNSENSSMINAILFSYFCVFQQSSKLVLKYSWLNLSKKRETNIKNLKRKGGKKLIDPIVFLKKIVIRYFI